jgi:hypothetical protein
MVFAEWQVGQVFLTMVWFTLFFLWIWLVISVFADIFRSRDMGGVGKALWTLFVLVFPYLGVFAYLVARGHKMHEHKVRDAEAADVAMRSYIRSAASTPADDLSKLADLRDSGVIDNAEFEAMKQRVVAAS